MLITPITNFYYKKNGKYPHKHILLIFNTLKSNLTNKTAPIKKVINKVEKSGKMWGKMFYIYTLKIVCVKSIQIDDEFNRRI